MKRRGERTALIVRVVRGEAPLTALATVGIVPHFEGNRLTFENPHRLEAPIAIQDLATGLLAEHHEPGYRSEVAYRRWAFTMMAWGMPTSHSTMPQPMIRSLWRISSSVSSGTHPSATRSATRRDGHWRRSPTVRRASANNVVVARAAQRYLVENVSLAI